MVATWYLGKTVNQGLVTGFLLNVKGHVDLLVIAMAETTGIWEPEACIMMVVTVMLQMLTAAPIAAVVVKLKQKVLSYHSQPLEWTPSTEELRLLLCIHGPRDVPTMLNLVEICGGSGDGAAADGEGGAPVDLYLLHLVELTKRITNSMLIHQQDDHPNDQECYYDGEDTRVIAAAVDIFRAETGISARQATPLHLSSLQATALSETITMHQDVYNAAVDIRASLLLLPFHKHQRVDGRMQDGRKQVRAVNEQIMRCAPCTVGILIDRGLGAPAAETGGIAARPIVHHVAVLFFGGGDDREALAFGLRLSFHPSVAVTVVRFLPPSVHAFNAKVEVEAFKGQDVLLAIGKQDMDRDKDEAFFSDFFNRYIVSSQVSYMEKYVENGAATVTALCSMEGMFSLFLVGKGSNRNSPLTVGLSEWEEFPELGSVADLLASSDVMSTGSVLVLQQCIKSNQECQILS
ncbi:hypothetical protein HPP92_006151 [Vanilla planifolia]|uniref:Uncharacterized protein n=1 Tax=Vanilla planifolia TaxID=51239 RepID=A0A835RVB0_VANPL|nr:hypothetical protein HPP92_006151 [Vanilla planifolia]